MSLLFYFQEDAEISQQEKAVQQPGNDEHTNTEAGKQK
jgi:hypothetical protein